MALQIRPKKPVALLPDAMQDKLHLDLILWCTKLGLEPPLSHPKRHHRREGPRFGPGLTKEFLVTVQKREKVEDKKFRMTCFVPTSWVALYILTLFQNNCRSLCTPKLRQLFKNIGRTTECGSVFSKLFLSSVFS
jgi:hypothetical protein